MPNIELSGCTPEPLMSYLKALGILRLVAEQKDSSARGAWRGGVFLLHSKHGKQELVEFLRDTYQPTPIFSPWNGGCGFYLKWDPSAQKFKSREVVEALNTLAGSSSVRLQTYRSELANTKTALAKLASEIDIPSEIAKLELKAADEGWSGKKKKDEIKKFLDSLLLFELNDRPVALRKTDKDAFLATLRANVLSNTGILWLDAALVLLTGREKNRAEAAVLGSGGNVGNSDFSALFAQSLLKVLPLEAGVPPDKQSAAWLDAALFGSPVDALSTDSIGQFNPGSAGGANSSQGLAGSPTLNPWDFILMIEGTLFLGGSVARRLGASRNHGLFPFAVESSGVGYGSAGRDTTRGELWLPLWDRPSLSSEVRTLFGEGRAEIGSRAARNGVDFARAVASLGIDRGIKTFVRYEFQERLGQSYLATPLGTFDVPTGRDEVGLLRDIDGWLDRYRFASREKGAPDRFAAAVRRIDAAVFDYCRYGGAALFGGIVRALGRAERELATGEMFRSNERRTLRPLSGLRPDWVEASNDGSPEFELALSLAGVRDSENRIGPLRVNLEPIAIKGDLVAWAERDPGVVWKAGDLAANLAAVLSRRMIDAARVGGGRLPVENKRTPASLAAISAFLQGSLDDQKIEELLWGLAAVDTGGLGRPAPVQEPATPLPRAYALLKLLFVPHALGRHGQEVHVLAEPEVLPLLRRGDVGQACKLAMRRLRASGLEPLPHPQSGRGNRDGDWQDAGATIEATRLAAALLLPVGERSALKLLDMVTRRQDEDDEDWNSPAGNQPEGAISA